jgi:membrane protein DedA with SNARE-associated domain
MPVDWSIDGILAFIAEHRAWAAILFGVMAFGESLAFVGVLIPATTVMIAAGALVGAGVLPFWDLWLGGALGASAGDAISYWIGRKLGPRAATLWPFSRRPHWLKAGEAVFARWGWLAVLIGRFIGPLRATVPLVAGIVRMPQGLFQAMNVVSALIWIPVLVTPGALVAWVVELGQEGRGVEAALLAVAALALVGGAWFVVRQLVSKVGERPADDR